MKRHWPVGSEISEAAIDGGRMLYDTQRTSNFSTEFFEPEYWRQHDAIEGTALGRGTTWFIRSGDFRFVLRHYRRGGLMAKFSKDAYLWRGESETRSYAEWYLTYHLYRAGLPVPTPIAARYRRRGLYYRADIITQRIENSESLAAKLARGPLSLSQWIAVGRCIRRFHDAGVHHADLNAHNILLRGDEEVFLIDFDRGRLRGPGLWRDANLARLYRSLEKLDDSRGQRRLDEAQWQCLLAAWL
jgi:3-deoxy-D-manno-octulosonic acid kinase